MLKKNSFNSRFLILENNFFICIVVLSIIAVFASYSIPMLVAYEASDVFMYVNAWDEETHLTKLSSTQLLTYPGYTSSAALVYVLHSLGFSGAVQNVFFDLAMLPATALLIYFSCMNLGVGKIRSLLYVVLILFSSVLFNYANPYIVELYGVKRQVTMIMPGFESYPSVLRSPQPQLSYFIVSIAFFAWTKKNQLIWILLPLPFLYFFVGIGYVFAVAPLVIMSAFSFWKYNFFKNRPLLNFGLLALCIYLFSALMFIGGAFLLELMTDSSVADVFSKAYTESRALNIPLAFLITLPSFLFLARKYLRRQYIGIEGCFCLYISLGILLIANIHMLSGYSISYKNIHDYTLSIMAGIALSLFFESCYRHQLMSVRLLNVLQIILLLLVVAFVARSQGFKWDKLQFRIFIGQQISFSEMLKVKSDPLRAVVLSRNVSAKLAYSSPGMAIPPFSYQYYYLPYDKGNLDRAMEAARQKYSKDSPELAFFDNMYLSILKSGSPLPSGYVEYPPLNSYFFIEPKGSPFVYFP